MFCKLWRYQRNYSAYISYFRQTKYKYYLLQHNLWSWTVSLKLWIGFKHHAQEKLINYVILSSTNPCKTCIDTFYLLWNTLNIKKKTSIRVEKRSFLQVDQMLYSPYTVPMKLSSWKWLLDEIIFDKKNYLASYQTI